MSVTLIYWVNSEPERTHLVLLSCELVEECEPSFSFKPNVASTANKCDLVSFEEITVADLTSTFLLIEMCLYFSSVKRNHIYVGYCWDLLFVLIYFCLLKTQFCKCVNIRLCLLIKSPNSEVGLSLLFNQISQGPFFKKKKKNHSSFF